jgi:glutamate synthase (NADPH/NADH) large chain
MADEWDKIAGHKIEGVDLSKILFVPAEAAVNALRHTTEQLHALDGVLDRKLVGLVAPAIESGRSVRLEFPIKNTDRAVGAMLSGAVTKKYGAAGLADDTIDVKFRGSAGQSFGAFLCRGITFELEGDSNDYLGKGLSGGRIVVKPAAGTEFAPERNIIAGNTLLYGATSGEVFINGQVGERFCVRNSGATAVVEGVGDHCCEYMTGGVTVVLGSTGRNFAAGMSGGVAYVWNPEGTFDYFCNMEMVELSLIEEIADSRELKGLVTRHLSATGSPLAARMLENWAAYEEQFIKVMPIEYKKVLKIRKMEALERKIASVERDY